LINQNRQKKNYVVNVIDIQNKFVHDVSNEECILFIKSILVNKDVNTFNQSYK